MRKTASHLTVAAWALLSVLGLGCSDEFDPVSQVDKFRVLGVSVTPPEIRPEHTGPVTVRVLWSDPNGGGRPVRFAWVFCSGDVSTATGYQDCELLDETNLPPTILDVADGGDSFSVPQIPSDLFAEIPENEGSTITAIVLMCAGGELPPAEELLNYTESTNINALCHDGDGLSAYKAIELVNGSLYGDAPNTNPELESFSIDGVPLAPFDTGDAGPVEAHQVACDGGEGCEVELELEARFTADSYQTYTTVEFDEPSSEQEHPFISWFATGGELSASHYISESVDDFPEAKWELEEAGVYTLFAVANDGRGGVDWREYRVELR